MCSRHLWCAACSADGHVMMSSLTLVLDGVLIEPPPPSLPLSATVQGSNWALATVGLSAPGSSGQAGKDPEAVQLPPRCIQLVCCIPAAGRCILCAKRWLAWLTCFSHGCLCQVCHRPLCWWMTASSWACRTGSRPCCTRWLPCRGTHSTRYNATRNGTTVAVPFAATHSNWHVPGLLAPGG